MIDGLVKIAGSLFIGGLGLVMILIAFLVMVVLVKEILDKFNHG